MNTELSFNKFDNMDWEMYAGCEGEPIIAGIKGKLKGNEFEGEVVVDDNGVNVCCWLVESSFEEVISYSLETTSGKTLVQELINWEKVLQDVSQLELLGFKNDGI